MTSQSNWMSFTASRAASTTEPLPELVGGAGRLLDPDDVDGWARAMVELVGDTPLDDVDLGALVGCICDSAGHHVKRSAAVGVQHLPVVRGVQGVRRGPPRQLHAVPDPPAVGVRKKGIRGRSRIRVRDEVTGGHVRGR